MSFFANIEQGTRNSYKDHVPDSVRNKIAEKGQEKDKLVLPPQCYFEGILKCLPQTSFQTQSFVIGNSVDFYLNYSGFLESVRLEMLLQINPAAANPVSFIGPYLIDRYEVYSTNGDIMQTFYNDQIYLESMKWNLDRAGFEQPANGLSATFSAVGPFAANATTSLEMIMPMCISDAQLKGNSTDRFLLRVYFSSIGVTAGANTDLYLTSIALLQHADILAPSLEQRETMLKRSQTLKYRTLNPQRIADISVQMAPSSFYDIQLTAGTGLSAFIAFMFRATPLTSSTVLAFQPCLKYEFYSQNSQIVGSTIYPLNSQSVLAQKLGGAVFKSTIGQNIFLIPFASNPLAAVAGNVTGEYALSTREYIRIYTPASLTAGSFVVTAYSWDYATLTASKGSLNYSK